MSSISHLSFTRISLFRLVMLVVIKPSRSCFLILCFAPRLALVFESGYTRAIPQFLLHSPLYCPPCYLCTTLLSAVLSLLHSTPFCFSSNRFNLCYVVSLAYSFSFFVICCCYCFIIYNFVIMLFVSNLIVMNIEFIEDL